MKPETRSYAARVDNLPAASGFVEDCVDRFRLRDQQKYAVLLALEEAFVNICSYAYPGGTGTVEVTCDTEGGAFVLDVADHGRPFDVLSLPEPDTTADVTRRPVGGLGVHFIRRFSTSVTYRRDHDRNVLRMVFTKPQDGSSPGPPQ